MTEADCQQLTLFELQSEEAIASAAELATGEVVQVAPIDHNPTEPVPQRVAFGRYVKPEMYDVFGDYDLSDVTEKEKQWVTPENIGSFLFEQDTAVPYTVKGVALNTTEHGLLARHPKRLAEAAEQKSLRDKDLDDEVIATGKRAEIHALENKLEAMTSHADKLAQQREFIKELRSEARKPGFAHKSPEHMKMLLSAAWVEFTGMLDVIHVQRGWDDDKRKRAETTLIHFLTQGSQRDRVAHWQGMLELSDGYLGARSNLFAVRARETTQLLQNKNAAYGERFI